MKISLSYGINLYPNPANNLRGCVNDAKGWASILTTIYGFENCLLLDEKATVENVSHIFGDIVDNAQEGDIIVLTGSSHGTSLTDVSGDEIDRKDEAICLYDGILLDDDLGKIIDRLPDGVSLTVISDSCYSGTVTRDFTDSQFYQSPKCIAYESIKNLYEIFGWGLPSVPIVKVGKQESEMREILISGCNDKQFSYDANINGVNQGAFSYYAQMVIKQNSSMTYNQFAKALSLYLPCSQYNQSPQLEGSKANKSKLLFA